MNRPDLRDATMPAGRIRQALDLRPHSEGGHYRETWRAAEINGGRGASSSILFLLAAEERSHWHRMDAAETWLWQAGAPLRLEVADPAGVIDAVHLGPALDGTELTQVTVEPQAWQSARSMGGVDARRLRGRAGVRIRGVRTRSARMVAAVRFALPNRPPAG